MVATIELKHAKRILEATEERASDLGCNMVLSVTNSEGNLIALHRMTDAKYASLEASKDKAYTAATTRSPTHNLADSTQPGETLWGLHTANHIVVFGGGVPLTRDGTVVGAIGVSGGDVDEDIEVAEIGAETYQKVQ